MALSNEYAMNIEITPVQYMPEIRPGMDLTRELEEGIRRSGLQLQRHDILAVTQKIVSKAEGRLVTLSNVQPSPPSIGLASQTGKDPKLVEVILSQSRRVVRVRGEVLICETSHGYICANAGVDRSNVEGPDDVALLPKDPDRSARVIADALGCGVIVTDTFGRPWREGLVDLTIGLARVPPFVDLRGKPDFYGREMKATVLAAVDALAGAAGLVMGKTNNTPAALIRGFVWSDTNGTISDILRKPEGNLFL